MVAGVVGGTAYALFSDSATVQGVNITTGNADIRINDLNSLPSVALFAGNLYPGWIGGQPFKLSNASTSPIGLNTDAKMTSYSGNWGVLNSQIEVALIQYVNEGEANWAASVNDPAGGTIVANTGWQSLSNWNSTGYSFGSTIPQGEDRYYVMWGRVSATADNAIAGKTLNTNWVINGTQAP